MIAMMRDDWWWPWWVSTLIDLGVVAVALLVWSRASCGAVRAVALLFVLGGLVAAVIADRDEGEARQLEGPTDDDAMRGMRACLSAMMLCLAAAVSPRAPQ
jgi:hypothetical protein